MTRRRITTVLTVPTQAGLITVGLIGGDGGDSGGGDRTTTTSDVDDGGATASTDPAPVR